MSNNLFTQRNDDSTVDEIVENTETSTKENDEEADDNFPPLANRGRKRKRNASLSGSKLQKITTEFSEDSEGDSQTTVKIDNSNKSTDGPVETRRPDVDVWEVDRSGLYGLKLQYLNSLDITPPLSRLVQVENFRCEQNELREVMELAGHVVLCSVIFNSQRKYAKVMYSHPLEAVQAISMLHGQILYGIKLRVVMDRCLNSVVLPKGLLNVGRGLGVRGKPLPDIVRHYKRYVKGKNTLIDSYFFRHPTEILNTPDVALNNDLDCLNVVTSNNEHNNDSQDTNSDRKREKEMTTFQVINVKDLVVIETDDIETAVTKSYRIDPQKPSRNSTQSTLNTNYFTKLEKRFGGSSHASSSNIAPPSEVVRSEPIVSVLSPQSSISLESPKLAQPISTNGSILSRPTAPLDVSSSLDNPILSTGSSINNSVLDPRNSQIGTVNNSVPMFTLRGSIPGPAVLGSNVSQNPRMASSQLDYSSVPIPCPGPNSAMSGHSIPLRPTGHTGFTQNPTFAATNQIPNVPILDSRGTIPDNNVVSLCTMGCPNGARPTPAPLPPPGGHVAGPVPSPFKEPANVGDRNANLVPFQESNHTHIPGYNAVSVSTMVGPRPAPAPLPPPGGYVAGPVPRPFTGPAVVGASNAHFAPFQGSNHTTVQLSNLPPNTTFQLLSEKLSYVGQVLSLQFTTLGCAEVRFGQPTEAALCIQRFNNINADRHIITARYL